MTNFTNTLSSFRLPSFRPSIETDELRPALLLTGTQIVVSLTGALLLTSGAVG